MSSIAGSAQNRIAELGEILAAGVMRVLASKSNQTSLPTGEISLDLGGTRSGPDLQNMRESAEQ